MNIMISKDKSETSDQSIVVEDLSAQNAKAIEGGGRVGDDKRQDYLKIHLKEDI
jgi:ribose 5-phosphate isomerase RpiB